MLALSLTGLDRGSDTDLFLSGSGVWCANRLFQLQQIHQQLLQVNAQREIHTEGIALTYTYTHTQAGELQ